MDHLRANVVLGIAVLLGSAIPFVPTGELVSGAAAAATHSNRSLLLIFVISWLCAVVGDTLMLVEARLGAGKLRPWLASRKFARRVDRSEKALTENAFHAIVIGRLIPAGRTPVIVAMGLSRFPLKRFLAIDTVACGLWALVYASVGSVGGWLIDDPVWAMVIAVVSAVCLGILIGQIPRLISWLRARTATEPEVSEVSEVEAERR